MNDENNDDEAPGVTEWTTWTTDHDRVKAVTVTDGEPRSARGIAEEAVVSPDRTREILNELVEEGVVTKAERHGETRFGADRDHMREESIRILQEATDRDELQELQDDMVERLNEVGDPAHERLIEYRLKIVAEALTLPPDE